MKALATSMADFLPSLNANFSGNRTTGQQFIFNVLMKVNPFVDVTSQSFSGNMSANITIFNGFENIYKLKTKPTTLNYHEKRIYREQEEQLIFDTAIRFLQVILENELLEIAKENLVTSQRQLEQVQAQVEVGSRPAVDLYESRGHSC